MSRAKTLYVFLFFLYFMPAISFSQEIANGAFIAPLIKAGVIKEQTAVFAGVRGGWVINNRFVIGGIFQGLVSDVKPGWTDPLNGFPYLLSMNYGGLDLEFIFLSNKFYSASAELLTCGGGIKLKTNSGRPSVSYYGGDFSVWEPQLNAEIFLNSWLRLSVGAGYRIIRGLDYFPYFPDNNPDHPSFKIKDIEGFTGIIALKIGVYE